MDQAREDEGIRENKSYPTSLTDRPFRAGVDLVLFPVTVYDERDHFVTGLIKDNFEVFENKNPQNVASFSSEDVPVSIGIIFDVSGSMGHKIDSARMAVSQFLRVSNPADEYFLIGFNDNPVKLSGFTHEVNTLLSKTMFLEPKGRTALLDAIYLGLNEMKNASYSRKALLVISDGGDNNSRYSEGDIRKAVREANVEIYSIGVYEPYPTIGRTPEELGGPNLMGNLAEMTGGRNFIVDSIDKFPAIAEEAGRQLRSVYILGYKPTDPRHDGKWRKIQVKLRLPKAVSFLLRVYNRSGYYAPYR